MLARCEAIIFKTMCRQQPLEHFLLEDDSEELKQWQDWRTAHAAFQSDRERPAPASAPAWPQKHAEVFRAKNLLYPPILETLYDEQTMSIINTLPRRAAEIIAFLDLSEGKVNPNGEEEIVDIGQGITRIPRCVGAAPCLTPGALMWCRKRRRPPWVERRCFEASTFVPDSLASRCGVGPIVRFSIGRGVPRTLRMPGAVFDRDFEILAKICPRNSLLGDSGPPGGGLPTTLPCRISDCTPCEVAGGRRVDDAPGRSTLQHQLSPGGVQALDVRQPVRERLLCVQRHVHRDRHAHGVRLPRGVSATDDAVGAEFFFAVLRP